MSMAARCWLGKLTRHLRLGLALALMVGALSPALLMAQSTDAAAVASQQKAHAALDTMIQALGGPAWVSVRTSREHVRIASFFQGNPTGEVADAVISREDPNQERIELDKGHVVQIYSGSSGWEITYKGKKDLPAEKVEDHMRWQRHSLRKVLDRWMGDPTTVALDEGTELGRSAHGGKIHADECESWSRDSGRGRGESFAVAAQFRLARSALSRHK